MDRWLQITQLIANIATGFGVIGLLVAFWQHRDSQRSQREATALGVWKDYLQLAQAHPTLSSPHDIPVNKSRDADFRQYEWFVSSMLFACEQILALQRKDKEWRATLKAQLGYHSSYLCGPFFKKELYDPDLVLLADEVCAERKRALNSASSNQSSLVDLGRVEAPEQQSRGAIGDP